MKRQKIWDFWARHYENLWVQKVSLGPTRREIINYLAKIIKKDQTYKILDVGCGTGQLLREIRSNFKDSGLELTGIDFSQGMIEQAKSIGGADSSITFRQMDVNQIDGLKEDFDIIICTHSFPYYQDQQGVLKKFRGLLKEEGYLFLAQASQNNLYDAITMFFVKFTTGRAKYPSVKTINQMTKDLFKGEALIRIRERFFMPSIYLFILKGVVK